MWLAIGGKFGKRGRVKGRNAYTFRASKRNPSLDVSACHCCVGREVALDFFAIGKGDKVIKAIAFFRGVCFGSVLHGSGIVERLKGNARIIL